MILFMKHPTVRKLLNKYNFVWSQSLLYKECISVYTSFSILEFEMSDEDYQTLLEYKYRG